MAVKTEELRDWIRVLVPVAYLVLLILNSTGEAVSWDVKYYYYMHRGFFKLTRWSRAQEAKYMEWYYGSINE